MLLLCLPLTQVLASDTLRVACFSQDVSGLDPLAPAFDPDSYTIISQLFDPLVYLDLDGKIQPGLASAWKRITPTTWEFTLRRGVRFHNGEPFDSRAVKFTFDYLLDPANKAGNAWVFSTLRSVEIFADDPYRVRFHTYSPDGMFLNRHSMFGSICPPAYFSRLGPRRFHEAPVGTGPYRFGKRVRGKFIELEANTDYWQDGVPIIPKIRFVILPESDWVQAFADRRVDFLPNLGGNQTSRLMESAKGDARIVKKLVLSGYQVLLSNQGALMDRRVRRALNYAVDKDALVRYADFGNARVLASLGKKGEFGSAGGIRPYRYDPQEAERLLVEADIARPLRLKTIVARSALPLAKIIAFDVSRLGVILDMQVVSRPEWAKQIIDHKLNHRESPGYDVAINLVDNPIYSLAFHAGLFLHSESPWALLESEDYDARYLETLRTVDPVAHRQRLEQLDRYIHDEALMIFTTQRIITAAVRKNLVIPGYSLNGHLDYIVLSSAHFREGGGSP